MKTQFTDEEKLVHIQEMRLLANEPDLWNFEETKYLVLQKLDDLETEIKNRKHLLQFKQLSLF